MTREKLQMSFFIGLLLTMAVTAFLIFLPYFDVLVVAAVLAIIFDPLYIKILAFSRIKEWLASLLTIFIIVLIVLIPLSLLGVLVWQETAQFYGEFTQSNGRDSVIAQFSGYLNAKLAMISPALSLNTEQLIRQTASWILENTGAIFSGAAQFIFGLFLTIITVFYLLKDGSKISRALTRLSPLSDEHDEILMKRFTKTVHSVVVGTLTVALIQGLLVAIGFSFFGVPRGLLWGAVAVVAALIPFIGTTIVVVPAIAYLFLSGNAPGGIGLLIWGAAAVGMIDNFLAPKLIERGIRIHPLLILFSVLGGLAFFGPIGFLAGPLILSLLFALLEMYQEQFVEV